MVSAAGEYNITLSNSAALGLEGDLNANIQQLCDREEIDAHSRHM